MSNVENLIRLCDAVDVQDGVPLRVDAPGFDPLVVCRTDAGVHVLDDTCSHGMASLSEGEIEGGRIYCPFHSGSFDLATGEPMDPPCTIPIKAYRAIERDGGIYISPLN